MIRRIQVVVGLAATMLNIVAIVYFLGWIGQTDFVFGHKEGPPGHILTALWLALIGVVGTAAWLLIGLRQRLAARRSTQEKSAFSGWIWIQGITLIVLLLPACLIIWCGATKFPDARIKLQIDRMRSGEATPAILIKGLRSSHPRVRSAASRGLGMTREKSAIDALAECLCDDNSPVVRTSAAQALARIADPRAMGPLVAALEDESNMVRRWAIVGLGALGNRSCIPALEKLAETDSGNRRSAQRAIEAIKDRKGVESVPSAPEERSNR